MLQRYLLLKLFFVIAVMLFSIELLLEWRHYSKGYATAILGKKANVLPVKEKAITDDLISYGPFENFPFRSLPLSKEGKSNVRIWIASSSHAEHSNYPPSVIFPNKICASIECEVINGSKAGMSIEGNVALIEQYAETLVPDFALLYQLSLIIEYQQGEILGKVSRSVVEKQNSILDFSTIKAFLQTTSAYQHLSDYIGGNLKLQGFLESELPMEMEADFERQINLFLSACEKYDIQPILTTFAASHTEKNIDSMHHSVKTNFVRYNAYLSPSGWLNMVKRYNGIIKEIAEQQNIPLIDLHKEIGGEYSLFVDFVHFNEEGHSRVAEIVAREIEFLMQKLVFKHDL